MAVTGIHMLHGAHLPRFGMGTWPMDDAEAERVIPEAIAIGYRLIDTAFNYRNESGVGRGLRASGIDRDDVFITTKFNRESHGVAGVAEAFDGSCKRLGVDYIDLMLVHWPNPDQDRYVDAWRGLVGLLEQQKVRAIGVSNFKAEHIDRIVEATGVVPDLNQVELNPYLTRDAIRAYDAQAGIVTQSWSPIGRGGELLDDPVIVDIAGRHDATSSQVVLAWHLALGLAVVPKSSNTNRLRENFESQQVRLSEEEITAISDLDRGDEHAVDSDVFGH